MKNPDDRSTTPDPAVTNYTHPAAAGSRTSVPGEGVVMTGDDTPSSQPAEFQPRPVIRHRHGEIADGVNRVEDVVPGGEARLSLPSEEAGPSSRSVGLPELADPNYSAATPGARGVPAQDSPLGK